MSSMEWAVSRAANCMRSRLACCGRIPATLPDSKNFFSPLCRNDLIIHHGSVLRVTQQCSQWTRCNFLSLSLIVAPPGFHPDPRAARHSSLSR
jgi:hypothetical protein